MAHDHPWEHGLSPRGATAARVAAPAPDHGAAAAPGHNHGAGHLHSHPHGADAADALQVLATQFIEGWRAAGDKTAYLRLAGVPFEIDGAPGEPGLKLVDVSLRTDWQVATASPAFGSAELSYLPFPGPMVTERTNMALVYVSLRRREEVDLRVFLAARHDLR